MLDISQKHNHLNGDPFPSSVKKGLGYQASDREEERESQTLGK